MGIEMGIVLSEESFGPGDLIEGNVVLINSGKQSRDIKELEVSILGQEHVQWVHTYCSPLCCFFGVGCVYRCTKTKSYEDGYNFMNLTIPLLGETTILQGRNEYPFQFSLPLEVPSSYIYNSSTRTGRIGYFISSKIRDAGFLKLVDKESVSFRVNGILDLNDFPDLQNPKTVEKKQKKGKKGIRLEIMKQGLVPGDRVHFKLHLFLQPVQKQKQNYQPPTIRVIKEERLVFKRHGKSSKSKEMIVVTKSLEQAVIETMDWEDTLDLPNPLHLTNLGGSEFISLSYFIQVIAFGWEDVVIPIVIGSVPFESEEEMIEMQTPHGHDLTLLANSNDKVDKDYTPHEIATEPNSSGRLNRNAYGQYNPGFTSQEMEIELDNFTIHK